MSVTINSGQVTGLDAQPIAVEVDITPGLHVFAIVGLADKEVQESRERIGAAIKNLGALAPHKKSQRVIINLAPANVKKEGPAFDLPIALGYLLASGQVFFDPRGMMFLGELGLNGELRPVTGVLPIALAARAAGFSEMIVPKGNGAEAAAAGGLRIREVENLADAIDHLAGRREIPIAAGPATQDALPYPVDFRDIRGQSTAKRALEIAAAGGHNAILSGPPGAGKTILASALPSILPPLSADEALEVSKIYSVSGLLDPRTPIITQRPFRNPHHTSSHTAIIGGGSYPRPGEVTLAHRGVLFLDEFPEFDRRVIESLRQPLEEHSITVARTHGVQTFPAQFMLIAAMNPCPCGNFGNPIQDCACAPGAILKYRKKISGPLMDRIDLHVETPAVGFDELRPDRADEKSSAEIAERVLRARSIQEKRFRGTAIRTNSQMRLREIKRFIRVGNELQPTLRLAHERWRLSARGYHRLLKLSRTIADLAGSEEIKTEHVSEALQYRPKSEL